MAETTVKHPPDINIFQTPSYENSVHAKINSFDHSPPTSSPEMLSSLKDSSVSSAGNETNISTWNPALCNPSYKKTQQMMEEGTSKPGPRGKREIERHVSAQTRDRLSTL